VAQRRIWVGKICLDIPLELFPSKAFPSQLACEHAPSAMEGAVANCGPQREGSGLA
jgi:hypothetical protein